MKNKIIKLIVIVYSIFSTQNANSQAPAIDWQAGIGGNSDDYLEGIDITADGGFILAGYSNSTGISGDKTEANTPGTGSDYWVLKLNSVGIIEWQNTIGGNHYDDLFDVAQTSDGGYILGGHSRSPISGDKTESVVGFNDYWVIKLNSVGAIQWQNTIKGPGYDELYSIEQTLDGGYILGGWSNFGSGFDKADAGIGGSDYWVIKLDAIGNIMWQNLIGGSQNDELQSVAQTADGGYILGGFSWSGISGDKTEASQGQLDYWVVKIDGSGVIEWQNSIGGSMTDWLYSVKQTSDGGYILGGYSDSGISGDKTETNMGMSYAYWVVKLNSSGNIEWQNTIGGSGTNLLKQVLQTADGGYILGGSSGAGISYDKTEESRGGDDYWLVKLNPLGDIMWQKTIGGNYWDYATDLEITSDGGYVIAGYSASDATGDKTVPNKGGVLSADYWVVKLEPDVCTPETEICNLIDDDCNGLADDNVIESISLSADGATTFCEGGSVELAAIYSGTAVQWKKGGVNIPGATNATYVATQKGTYTCETSSACDTELSAPIYVNVQKNPNALITAGGATTFCPGGSVILSANAGAGLSYQWIKGGSQIPGATSINYTATTTGIYKCRVMKAASGCYKNSNTIAVYVSCKEDDVNSLSNILIYPNPASTNIYIESGNTNNKEIFLYNESGQLVRNIHSTQTNIEINTEGITPGIYFIRITTNNLTIIEKIILQK